MKFNLKNIFLIVIFFTTGTIFSQSNRTSEQAKTFADTLYAQLLRGDNFEELAKVFSEDVSSAKNGGDLGWTSKGTLVREYEDVAYMMKPDEISLPFRSQFGYYIVLLLEKNPDAVHSRHILIRFHQ
jgi:parvulin-like peptidyl-prolyl isomerase